jgi:hypothetical protein
MELAKMLVRDVKEGRLKPSLRIHASVENHSDSDSKFDASRARELKTEIAAIQKELKNWDAEEVAAQAESALRSELEVKKAQLKEAEARMKRGKKAAGPGEEGNGKKGAEDDDDDHETEEGDETEEEA